MLIKMINALAKPKFELLLKSKIAFTSVAMSNMDRRAPV